MTTWLVILATAVACYLAKFLGLSVPTGVLTRPAVRRLAALLPIALLAALTGIQTFGSGTSLTFGARVAGVAAAGLALFLRAPFLVVVGAAVVVTALVRLAG
jgi:branched-subunit amino acid transport protein